MAAVTHLRVCRFLLVCRWPCCKRDCGGAGQEAASPGIPQETPSTLPLVGAKSNTFGKFAYARFTYGLLARIIL